MRTSKVPAARRGRTPTILAALAVIAAVAGGGWYVLRSGQHRLTPDSTASRQQSDAASVAPGASGGEPRAGFVGEPACAKCHETQTTEWRQSDHARAMELATDADRPRRLQQRDVHLRRHHLVVLPARRQVLRAHRRPRRRAARLRDQVHVRLPPAAAVPRRVSRRAAAVPGHRVGRAAEGAGRPALVPPLPGREDHRTTIRCTGRGRTRTGTTCAPTATRPTCGATTTWRRTPTRRRGPRSTCRARRATARARRTWRGPRTGRSAA